MMVEQRPELGRATRGAGTSWIRCRLLHRLHRPSDGNLAPARLCPACRSAAKGDNKVRIDYRPVHMKPLGDMDFVPPKPRVY